MSERQFYTYLHCKPNGDPFYVGKGFGRRSHVFSKRNLHHTNTVKKYGMKNILVYVFMCETESQALSDEVAQIRQLRLDGFFLVNQTDGGEGTSGYHPTADHIAKSIASRQGYTHSEETKRKIAMSRIGKKRSDELKRKLSEYAKSRPESHREKLSASLKGKPRVNGGTFKKGHKISAETRAKMSKRMMGNTVRRDHLNSFDAKHCD